MTSATDQPTVSLPSGARMPLVGFGTWQLTGRDAYDSVSTALAAGYRHIDTATMYRNEEEVGRAVRDSGVPRTDIFITTKWPPERPGRVRETIEASLAALGTDYLDLWLIHAPPGNGGVDVWREFIGVRDEGLTRSIGVSNYDVDQIDVLVQDTGELPAVNQIRWSPTLYDAKVAEGHRDRGVVLEGYSAFKNTNFDEPVLVRIAEAHGVTSAQVVLRWHVDHGFVVIPKSATPERIRANLDVFGFSLTERELHEIDALGR